MGKNQEGSVLLFKCDRCGKRIGSDRPRKCFFCGKSFNYIDHKERITKTCPTCSAFVTGSECVFCGDELYGDDGSSYYQDCIEEQFKNNKA